MSYQTHWYNIHLKITRSSKISQKVLKKEKHAFEQGIEKEKGMTG